MNDDEFEDKLRALTGKFARPDPTLAWKADILARARQAQEQNAPRTPRWLLTALGVAWLLIVVLHATTPANVVTPREFRDAEAFASQGEKQIRMLMAFHANPELLDLP